MSTSASDETKASQILREWSEMELSEAVAVIVGGILLIWIVKKLVPWIAERLPNRFRLYVLPWEPVLRLLLLLMVITYVTPLIINPKPQNLFAILGAVAFAIGFAFKDYVSSLIAGVVALYERPYRSGDWVRISDTYGEVQTLNLRTVQVLTPDDTIVAVPHSKIWENAVYNANNGQHSLMCVAHFYLHPVHDGQQVRQMLHDVALTSPYLQVNQPVLVVAFEKPWGTHYQVKAYPIDGRDQFQFITDVTLRGKAALRQHDIQPAVALVTTPDASS